MKQCSILAILWLSICLSSSAQTQQGYVKTKGRLGSNGTVIHGTPLGGATVTVKGRNAVVSGRNGKFSLAIPGNSYYLQNVQKQGYVLTDPDVLSKQYVQSKNVLTLVMEDKNQQTIERRAIERKISSNLYAQLQKRSDELEALKEQHMITEEKYRELLQKLNSDQDNNENIIKDMAERYSKMDFDQIDEFNRRISDCIINGRLTEADSLLRTKGDITERIERLNKHHEANAQKRSELEQSVSMEQRDRDELAQDCYSRFEIFMMKHQNDSAAYYIERRASLDTTQVKWLEEAGIFLVDYCNRFEDGLKYFTKGLSYGKQQALPAISVIANSYYLIGYTYYEQGDYNNAAEYLTRAIDVYNQLSEAEYKGIARCYNSLGLMYLYKGDYEQALENMKKGLEIRLAIEDKDDDLIEDIAACYSNLGGLYLHMNNQEESSKNFEKSLEIRKTLKTCSKRNLAISYNNVGYSYLLSGNEAKAMDYYLEAYNIRKELFGNRHPHVALSLNNIAGIYYNQNKYEEALDYYLQALSIRAAIYGDNHTDVAISYNNLGTTYLKLSRYEEALDCFEKAMQCVERNNKNHIYNLKKTIQGYIDETKEKMNK